MREARFFINAPLAIGQIVELPASAAHHAIRVLRLRSGKPIVLFNGKGGEFVARFSVERNRAFAAVERFDAVERESPLAVILVQSWIATDKLDWVIEKAVELGVHAIIMAPAQRAVIRLSGARLQKRVARLNDIAIAACCQCGRNRIPTVSALEILSTALQASLQNGAHGVLLDANAHGELTSLADAQPIALAVGPEGGFDEHEIALAKQLGFRSGRLGLRVLRTETAGLAALAALQAVSGDFSGSRELC